MSQRRQLLKNTVCSPTSVTVESTVVNSHWIMSKTITNVYVFVPSFVHLEITERKFVKEMAIFRVFLEYFTSSIEHL